MYTKNKRGLSAVVTTLLIILLTIIAVGIIWVVIRNLVEQGSQQIELGTNTLKLEIKSVKIQDNNVTVIVVKRNPGKGEFIGMNFIFSNETDSEIIREDTPLKELEEKTFTFTLSKINTSNLKTISVSPIFKINAKETIGDVTDTYEIKSQTSRVTGTGSSTKNTGPFAELGYTGMGRVEYTISSNNQILPEFKRAVVIPLDVLPGDSQTFIVHLYSPYPIVNVTSFTQLDNSNLSLNFEYIGRDIQNNEIWSATWIVNDTHTREYKTTITAINSQENQNSITLTWTDSCQSQITHGQDSVISSDCSTGVGNIAGLDGGNLIINSGKTLTIDNSSKWIFNDGKNITVNGNIILNGGEITKGFLYLYDADADNYAKNSTLTWGTSPTAPSGRIRAKDAAKYFNGNLKIDCYDNNQFANPDQTSYFDTHRGDGSYDYNCDGLAEQQYPYNGACSTCDTEICPSTTSYGGPGWYGSVPGCGITATYINEPGWCDSVLCTQQSCTTISQTQRCR